MQSKCCKKKYKHHHTSNTWEPNDAASTSSHVLEREFFFFFFFNRKQKTLFKDEENKYKSELVVYQNNKLNKNQRYKKFNQQSIMMKIKELSLNSFEEMLNNKLYPIKSCLPL
jgi:hypothetical protein